MKNPTVFAITIDDVQEIARMHAGRALTPEELASTAKGIEWGMSEIWGDIIVAAFPDTVHRS